MERGRNKARENRFREAKTYEFASVSRVCACVLGSGSMVLFFLLPLFPRGLKAVFIISVCGEGIEGYFRREKSVIMVSGGREEHVAKWVVKQL